MLITKLYGELPNYGCNLMDVSLEGFKVEYVYYLSQQTTPTIWKYIETEVHLGILEELEKIGVQLARKCCQERA